MWRTDTHRLDLAPIATTSAAAMLAAARAVHAWWPPKRGVDGWTAEPRERYLALLGVGPDGRRPR